MVNMVKELKLHWESKMTDNMAHLKRLSKATDIMKQREYRCVCVDLKTLNFFILLSA